MNKWEKIRRKIKAFAVEWTQSQRDGPRQKKAQAHPGLPLWVRLHANLVEPANIWYTRHVADSFAMEGGESRGYRRIFCPFGFGRCDLVLHLQMAG